LQRCDIGIKSDDTDFNFLFQILQKLWIKAGRISDEDFYVWSEQARAQKKKYDEGATTLEDFQRWLKES
jgi:hypothetical protein